MAGKKLKRAKEGKRAFSKEQGLNRKRLALALLFGFLFGLLCAYLATIRQPIPLTPLLLAAAVYTRTLAGFFIGLLEKLKCLKNKTWNALLRGALIGFLVSVPLALPYGIKAALGFSVFGAIYGAITDYLATRFA